MVWSVFAGIVCIVLGAFIFLKPDLLWSFTEKWKSYHADTPSALYLKSTKLGGVLFILLGVAMSIFPLILK